MPQPQQNSSPPPESDLNHRCPQKTSNMNKLHGTDRPPDEDES